MVGLPNEDIAVLLGVATPQQKEAVDKVVAECLNIASDHFGHQFSWPAVKFNLKGTVAGRANAHEIDLNAQLLKDFYETMLSETLPHEVAHVVVRQHYGHSQFVAAHGNEWKFIMKLFGLPPNRTHDMPVKKARVHKRNHVYKCYNCDRVHKCTTNIHNKLQCGQIRVCKCGGYLTTATYWGEVDV